MIFMILLGFVSVSFGVNRAAHGKEFDQKYAVWIEKNYATAKQEPKKDDSCFGEVGSCLLVEDARAAGVR